MVSTKSGHGRKVVIVGAGIAGMTAALYLARAGFEVTVLEKSAHVGGKFGAVRGRAGAVHEHAYHFLGDWCANFWEVAGEIGLKKDDDFRPSTGVKFLRPAATGKPFAERLSTLRLNRLGKDLTGSLDGGVIPPDDMMIWFYSLLELISYGRDLDEKEFLNRISVNGFMRSLPYMTDLAALLHQEAMVKAFAIPSYETSARSYRQFARFFSRDQDGFILNAPVSERFWPEFEKTLQAVGPSGTKTRPPLIRTGSSVETIEVDSDAKGVWVSGVTLTQEEAIPLDRKSFLLVTIPHGNLASIVERSPGLRKAAPRLLELRKLPARQMASLDLYFPYAIPGVPAEHVTLIDDAGFKEADYSRKDTLAGFGNRLGSRFALSFVDNYQAWHRDKRKETWLNVVSADFDELAKLPKDDARREIEAELARYLDFDTGAIDQERSDLQLNAERPLFTNSVGTWQYRPEAGLYCDTLSDVEFENLGLAGDYCRSEVDIVCLEGAVLTARRAACAIARKARCEDAVSEPAVPAEISQRTIEFLKREWEPWLRLAARRALGARGDPEGLRDPLGRPESLKRRLDLAT
jgi:Flavin containing amine oxidoreductase